VISRVRAIVQRRAILRLLIARDLKVKYSDSLLGYFWAVLEPSIMAGVYWTVFTQIFSRSVGEQPYLLFLVSGIFPWYWANGVIHQAAKALNKDARLVRSTNLPRETWVLRAVGSKGADFLLSIPVVILIALVYVQDVRLSSYALLIPLAILIQAVFSLGIGLFLAPIAVMFGDVDRLMRPATRMLFYLSPVIYGVQDVPAAFQDFYVLNPLAGIFSLYRSAFFPDQFPGWGVLSLTVLMSLVVLGMGSFVFARMERRVLKEI
jgi:ABC-2 type transport system permease protein